jgi:pyruvate formate lyase activating enzyme
VGGCNFRCPFCYNPDLVLNSEKLPVFDSKEILSYLKENQALLDGVTITGGEPLIQKKEVLIDFIKKVKELNLGVAIETNGTNPEMIEFLITHKLVDYLAMDVKAPLEQEKYNQLTGVQVDLKKIKKSIKIIKEAKIDSEFRTTVVPGLLNQEDILKITDYIKEGKGYYLQKFQSKETVGDVPKAEVYSDEWFEELKSKVAKKINIKLRI